MNRWGVKKYSQLIIIFFVFSITGSSSIIIGRPILKVLGVTLNNFSPIFYYPILVLSSFIFYQVFLVFYGWFFGQFQFFWNMEKKMLRRFGIII